jgi:hypothetical protein
MVSIPAARKHPEIPEYAFNQTASVFGGSVVDPSEQPYVEVLPGDPRYDDAVAAAQKRLDLLVYGIGPTGVDAGTGAGPSQSLVPTGPKTQAYSRWGDPGRTEDILDPGVLGNPACTLVPLPLQSGAGAAYPVTAIPEHCHWVITDATQSQANWEPRNGEWTTTLAKGMAIPPNLSCGQAAASVAQAAVDQQTAVNFLQNLEPLSTVKAALTTLVPFGLWQVKPGCHFAPSTAPPVSSFAANPPAWMSAVDNLSPDAPVYMSTPGEAVFKMICINCHGAKADSSGRLADNLATMTGGHAIVADFRDGLFGPVGTTYANIHRVFGVSSVPAGSSWTDSSIDDFDRAARYMAWMALGGTKVVIPAGILQIVSITKVLDRFRLAAPAGQQISANMLSTAKGLCKALLGCNAEQGESCGFNPAHVLHYSNTLIQFNGDAELWMRLCSLNNPPPIHVIGGEDPATRGNSIDAPFDSTGAYLPQGGTADLINPSSYPQGAPVGGNASVNQGLGPDNYFPWCQSSLVAPADRGPGYPACPTSGILPFTADDAEKWTVRGAINAGLAVFLYVKSLETSDPPPDYDQCEQLP